MESAWYINEGKKIKVNAYEINQSEYQNNYQGKLFCYVEGCPAQIVLVEQQKKEYKRFFRKLQGSKHMAGCPGDNGNGEYEGVGGN